jgi:hypothetical protein
VAVLCNGGSATNATTIANQIADSILPAAHPAPSLSLIPLPGDSSFTVHAGLWLNERRHTVVRTTADKGRLRRGNAILRRVGVDEFRDAGGSLVRFTRTGGRPTQMTTISSDGDTAVLRRVEEWRPAAAELASFAGSFTSPEVHGEPFIVALDSGKLVLRQGPRTRTTMIPIYRDAFVAGGRTLWFVRDARRNVVEMHIGEDRAWDVKFTRSQDERSR